MPQIDVVTGATGYTGRYITQELLDSGRQVRSLSAHPDRPNPFGNRVQVKPYQWTDPAALAASLDGVDTLYNTYWIRVAKGGMTHGLVVRRLTMLFEAARSAGVRRIVHLSITNPSLDSPLPYFRGKAEVETILRNTPGMSHAVVRPTVIFGQEDVLLNNIAWLLRRFHLFLVPGSGDYQIQPIAVSDVARLAVEMGRRRDDVLIDAVGPDVFQFAEMVRLIRDSLGLGAMLVHAPPKVALAAAWLLGLGLRDMLLSRDELEGLTSNLLVSNSGEPPTGATRLADWLNAHGPRMGTRYASEFDRHYR